MKSQGTVSLFRYNVNGSGSVCYTKFAFERIFDLTSTKRTAKMLHNMNKINDDFMQTSAQFQRYADKRFMCESYAPNKFSLLQLQLLPLLQL